MLCLIYEKYLKKKGKKIKNYFLIFDTKKINIIRIIYKLFNLYR